MTHFVVEVTAERVEYVEICQELLFDAYVQAQQRCCPSPDAIVLVLEELEPYLHNTPYLAWLTRRWSDHNIGSILQYLHHRYVTEVVSPTIIKGLNGRIHQPLEGIVVAFTTHPVVEPQPEPEPRQVVIAAHQLHNLQRAMNSPLSIKWHLSPAQTKSTPLHDCTWTYHHASSYCQCTHQKYMWWDIPMCDDTWLTAYSLSGASDKDSKAPPKLGVLIISAD